MRSVKLATAKTIDRLEKYVNEYSYSTGYRIDPETLCITNVNGAPVPKSWFVERYRDGFLFGYRQGSPA